MEGRSYEDSRPPERAKKGVLHQKKFPNVDQSEVEWDPEVPDSIVGARLAIKWAGQKWYEGLCDEYDAKRGQHHIHYDDNDKRWYFMSEKTFRVIGTGEIYEGTLAQSTAPYSQWTPYVSKNPDARTRTRFHCMVDPTFLKEGDQLVVMGTCAQLGQWNGARGVPLTRDPVDAALWTGEVELPFEKNESFRGGIFEWRFALLRAGEYHLEGGSKRRERGMQANFYGMFRRSQKKVFRGYNKLKKKAVLFTFTRQSFERMLRGEIIPSQFIRGYKDLHNSLDGVRSHAEFIFNELLGLIPEEEEWRAVTLLCLLAVIGQYGLSCKDHLKDEWSSSSTYRDPYYSGGGAGGYGYYSYKSSKPKTAAPSKWCHVVVERLPVERVFHGDLKQMLGGSFRDAITGLQECADRLNKSGSFTWLTVSPVLALYKGALPDSEGKKGKKPTAEFVKASETIRALAATIQAEEEKEAEEEEKKKEEEPEQKEKKKKKSLSEFWLRQLVRYAPTVEAFRELFDAGFMPCVPKLLKNVSGWIASYEWENVKELNQLGEMIEEMPALNNPVVAGALLLNHSCDGDKLKRRILEILAQTIGGLKSREDPELVELESAAKKWVRRIHAEDAKAKEKDEDDEDRWYSFGISVYSKPKKKKPSAAELAKRRLAALNAAIADVDDLLQIEFFDQNERGILFELGRCHFMRGAPRDVLQAICALGVQSKSFSVFKSPHVQRFFMGQSESLLDSLVPNCVRNPEALADLLSLLDESFTADSVPRHQLLFHVCRVAAGTNPPLDNILTNEALWNFLFRVQPRRRWDQESPLNALLQGVARTVEITARRISDNSVVLRVLHVVLRNQRQFLSLVETLKVSELSNSMLNARRDALKSFDTQLAEVQCYVKLFCNCGVKIDTSQMKGRVEHLTKKYNQLKLVEVRGAFKDMLAKYNNAISWLYRLQNSRMFLKLWRETGAEICQIEVEERNKAAAAPQRDAGAGGLTEEQRRSLNQRKRTIQMLAARVMGQQGLNEEQRVEIVAKMQEELAAIDFQLEHGVMEGGGDVDEKEAKELVPLIVVEDIVLNQEQVVKELIPRAQHGWGSLMNSVRSGKISIGELEATFGGMTKEECLEELHVLARTGSGKPSERVPDWMLQAGAQVNDFLLLVDLRRWLPGLMKLRDLLKEIFQLSAKKDEAYQKIAQLVSKFDAQWDRQTLNTIPRLVHTVRKDIAEAFTPLQLNFLTLLTECEGLIPWLMEHAETKDFNRLLQVCRECTADARLLSSIASLKNVRTLLLVPLYNHEPYRSLQDFLNTFRTEVRVTKDNVDDVMNIGQTFSHMVEVFENQTKSAGIRACYEVRDIALSGVFVFKAGPDKSEVLSLELKSAEEEEKGAIRSQPLEYLLDLRSKLMMTEISEEVERELHIRDAVVAFTVQLTICMELRDQMFELYGSGHFNYQQCELRQAFKVEDGLPKLQQLLQQLKEDKAHWDQLVHTARERYYFLNYFTMREILRMVEILSGKTQESEFVPPPIEPEEAKKKEGPPPTHWECPRCTLKNEMGLGSCSVCMAPRPAEFGGEAAPDLGAGDEKVAAGIIPPRKMKPLDEFTSLLHVVSSNIDQDAVVNVMRVWETEMSGKELTVDAGTDIDHRTGNLFNFLGALLGDVFGAVAMPDLKKVKRVDVDEDEEERRFREEADEKGVIVDIPPPPRLIRGKSNFDHMPICRAINPPGKDAKNAADYLVAVGRAAPIWVSCAESPSHVIEVVLSVYVRRARLPEPGEIVFCTPDTRLEEVELLFWRFIRAKPHGRGNCIFVLADIHMLSYTMQVAVVEKLREMRGYYGTDAAASLLFVSGKPRQVILNSFSAQQIDLPPLDTKTLQQACSQAFDRHCGETMVVYSNINGGGKSHWIMSTVSARQKDAVEPLCYRRVTFRESTTAATLVDRLSSVAPEEVTAFHIDIGHIIPANANTVLFELVILGLLKNENTCQVYFRKTNDVYFMEVPNSRGNKTAEALRFLSLLPFQRVVVQPEFLALTKPVFTNAPSNTRIACPDYTELVFVCKYIRAYENGKFLPGTARFAADFNAWEDEDITSEECFRILAKYCAQDGTPSFLIFESFIQFMNAAFQGMEGYAIFNGQIFPHLEGLQRLKHVFCNLLIETTQDMTLRNVPRGSQFGRTKIERWELDGAIDPEKAERAARAIARAADGAGAAAGADFAPPRLDRMISAELEDQLRMVGDMHEPGLVRQISEDLAERFTEMRKWTDTEHPVVLFYHSMRDPTAVDGLDFISTQRRFVDKYVNRDMKMHLEVNRVELYKEWDKLTTEQAMEIITKVEGYRLHRNTLPFMKHNPSYVITVDNLLKMLSIQLRLKNKLPVVIMGETGCGKSSLIRELCSIIHAPLRTLNIHGGMEDPHILAWMAERIAEAKLNPHDHIVVFLDEVNTCNCMSLFKEIVCDRSMNGVVLPNNISLIAACNPYRLKPKTARVEERMAGLIFDHFASVEHAENVLTGITDPLKNLVYRVHPLPESMIDFVFDFGALAPETEALYIKAMLRRELSNFIRSEEDAMMYKKKKRKGEEDAKENLQEQAADQARANIQRVQRDLMSDGYELTPFGEFVEVFAELICTSQEFVRLTHDNERSVVSLRDVARCVKIFRWFGEHFAAASEEHINWTLEDFFAVRKNARAFVRQAVIMALSYCYHARLPRDQRKDYFDALEEKWKKLQKPLSGYGAYRPPKKQSRSFFGFGGFEYSSLWGPRYGPRSTWLKLDAGTCLGTLRHVQKSFVRHMHLGEDIALNEALLENLFMLLVSILNKIPIFVVGKPGSSKSLAMTLIQQNLNGDASENHFLRALPAVEVFSYQCSPLSTSAGIMQAFDAAYRYREEAENTICVVLLDEVGLAEQSPHLPLKVLHKILDERAGEQAVVGISNWSLDPAKMNRAVHLFRPAPTDEDLSKTAEGMVRSANLSGYLQSLAEAYNAVYQNQRQPDFWGLREFYSTVRHINRTLQGTGKSLDSDVIMNAVRRNYGGRPQDETTHVINTFFDRLGHSKQDVTTNYNVVDLVNQNLCSTEARHLMLLTENNAALSLLFDYDILTHERTMVIFGSDFPLDQTDLQVCLNIQRIKHCMAEGITVVLVHCESLFESLYDLLNQHYTEYGGKLFVRLAFGTHSQLCPLETNFRVVVVVEKNDAYTRLAPPLLNRFEKQVMERRDLLTFDNKRMVERLRAATEAFTKKRHVEEREGVMRREGDMAMDMKTLRRSFVGFHTGFLWSLVQSVMVGQKVKDEAAIYQEALQRLLWVAVPEAVCRLSSKHLQKLVEDHQCDAKEIYFDQQRHSSLPSFTQETLEQWSDEIGSQVVLLTFSPLRMGVDKVLVENTPYKRVSVAVLHHLSSERDLVKHVDEFFDDAATKNAGEEGAVLIVQCDPMASSLRRIIHTKYICENARARFRKKKLGALARGVSAESAVSAEAGGEEKGDQPDGDLDEKEIVQPVRREESEGKEGKEGEVEEHRPQERRRRRGVHVILLVHLPRTDISYRLDFDQRWRYAFIDALEDAKDSGLPDIQSMLRARSFKDILDSLDLRQMLLNTFRYAMTRLVYQHVRTTNDVAKQIGFLLLLLQDTDSSFVVTCRKMINNMVERSGMALDVMDTANREDELALAGTFQAALHRKISHFMAMHFAIVFAHMDRNSGLFVVGEKTLVELWYYLFEKSFTSLSVFERTRHQNVVEVQDDGNVCHFVARFPFSFYLSNVLESMRQGSENAKVHTGDLLQQQFALLRLRHGLGVALPEAMLKRYLYDFTCMQCMLLHSLEPPNEATPEQAMAMRAETREFQANLIWAALTLSTGGTPPRLLSEIHSRYWSCEATLHAYFELVDAVPACRFEVLKLLEASSCLDYGTNLEVVGTFLRFLSPSRQGWKNVEQYGDWLCQIEKVNPVVVSLLAGEAVAEPLRSVVASAVVDEEEGDGKKPSDEKGGDEKEAGDEKRHENAAVRPVALKEEAPIQVVGYKERSAYAMKQLELRRRWEYSLFSFAFVRDVSLPLAIEPALAMELLRSLEGKYLRTRDTFRVLIKMFSDLNRSYARMGAAMECSICLRIPEDPVRACGRPKCQKLVCRACILAYYQTPEYKRARKCFNCQQPKAPPFTVDPRDRMLVDASRGKEQQLQRVARRFMEFFINQFCFDPTSPEVVDTKLLRDFIFLLANRPLEGFKQGKGEGYFIDVLPPGAGRVSLLRSLLNLSDKALLDFVRAELLQQLAYSARSLMDSPLAECYVATLEERLTNTVSNVRTADAMCATVRLEHLAGGKKMTAPAHEILKTVAIVRRIMVVFAEEICDVVDVQEEEEKKEQQVSLHQRRADLNRFSEKVARILSVKSKSGIPRSARMFLLKNLERRRGAAFVRSTLAQPPLAKGAWLKEWKETGEAGLMRFLGENKLPRTNPFTHLELWEPVHAAVSAALAPHGSFDLLNNAVGTYRASREFVGALLAAVFHEAYLLNVLQEIPAVTRRQVDKLREWLGQQKLQDASKEAVKRERALLLFFCQVRPALQRSPAEAFFQITPDSSSEHIGVVRLIVHMLIATMTAERGSLACFFHRLLTNPRALKDSFFPVMPEDATAMAVRVLGGRWYKCPNGHAYYVDMCGRPTVIQKCATCGVDIGGLNHNPLEGNVDLDPKLAGNTSYSQTTKVADKSEKNYCIRSLEEEKNPLEVVRALTPVPVRFIRLLLHSALVGAVATDMPVHSFTSFLNKTYTPAGLTGHRLVAFFVDHLNQDWKVLGHIVRRSPDDILVLLHAALLALKKPKKPHPAVLAQVDDRTKWEEEFEDVVMEIFKSDGLAERVEELTAGFQTSKEDKGSVFVAELLERVDIAHMAAAHRNHAWPALWRYHRPFSPEDFVMELNLNPRNEELHPVLALFLKEERQLRGVRYLPQVLEWLNLLLSTFNLRIDHDSAARLTVGEMFKSVPKQDLAKWHRAWHGFQKAWETSWKFVERFECRELPQMYKKLEMTENTPLSCCLPAEKDEGVCPLTLARFLGHSHNQFVERVDEVMLMRGEEAQRGRGKRGGLVMSKFFSGAHSLVYDKNAFFEFVEKQCILVGGEYDFKTAEEYLINTFFNGKPLIDLELRMVQYTNEPGALSNANMIGSKVRQELLPKDTIARILKELQSPVAAQRCLELLDLCMSFLQQTGGSYVTELRVEELKLSKYVQQVLQQTAEFGSRTVESQVRLKHIDSLREALVDFTVVDRFAHVRPRYRVALLPKQEAELRKACQLLKAELLTPLLRDFIVAQCGEETMGCELQLKMAIGFIECGEAYLADVPWFANNFPDHLQMRHILAVYEVLASFVEE